MVKSKNSKISGVTVSMKVLMAFFLIFTSCATRNVDFRFESYIQEFKSEALKYDIHIDDSRLTAIETAWIRDGYEGYCINLANNPWLRLRTNTFQKMPDHYKRMILFHEATHCFIKGRSIFHNNETMNTPWDFRMPKSILNGDGLDPNKWEFERYKECYLYELFHNSYLLDAKCAIWFENGAK